jgi:hypothetical protein
VSRPIDVLACVVPSSSTVAAAERQATYRRVGKRYSDLVEVMGRSVSCSGGLGAARKPKVYQRPDCLHDLIDALAQHTIPNG